MKVKIAALFIALLLIEVTLRLGFSLIKNISFVNPSEVIYRYYPMVKNIKEKYSKTDTGAYKILVLSCSTLHKDWGDFEKLFEQDLLAESAKDACVLSSRPVVFNASGIGLSSLDNLNCYRLLTDLKFDLVLVYGGINDSRFNNCPISVFKETYDHYKWNNEINTILRHPEMNFLFFPFFLDYTYQLFYESGHKEYFIPNHYSLKKDWWEYGSDFKSIKIFKKNVAAIQQLCKSKKEPLLLVTYCYYLPQNYTLERFKKKELDYVFQPNSRETEIWGLPKNVSAFLDSSNKTLIQIAIHNESYYLDMHQKLFSKNTYYADICHFSKSGLLIFTRTLANEIKKINHCK